MPKPAQRMRAHHRDARRGTDDRGAVATELALIFPLLIVLVMLPMQFALYWHGKQAADLAAEECVDAATELGSGPGAGSAAAQSLLGAGGGLSGVSIAANRSGDTVTCTVRGTVSFTVVGSYRVTGVARGPVERFIGAP